MTETREREKAGEEPLISFQVITDTHVTEDREHLYNRHFSQALADIRQTAPRSAAILHAGDVTDHGFPGEYAEFNRIWKEHRDGLPTLYVTTGNHDVGLGIWEDRIERFLDSTGTSAAYHDHWIGGYHFIFLGTEQNLELYCSLSGEQLTWLDEKLREDAKPDQPVFLFLHQPLKNTVAGSHEAQKWHGVAEDEELRSVLAKHPRTILFTGHTHWELEAANTYYEGGGELPSMFNAASVAYLWTDEDKRKEGSQGLFVEVYENRVAVRGRDFVNRKWVEAASFDIAYPVMAR